MHVRCLVLLCYMMLAGSPCYRKKCLVFAATTNTILLTSDEWAEEARSLSLGASLFHQAEM